MPDIFITHLIWITAPCVIYDQITGKIDPAVTAADRYRAVVDDGRTGVGVVTTGIVGEPATAFQGVPGGAGKV